MKYRIIYADCPWPYANFQGKGKSHGDVSAHYPTMTLPELRNLGIGLRPHLAEDCVLFLWATFPNLPEALSVLKAWGFEYKTVAFTWAKTRGKGSYSGLGFYTNANAEACLLGRRGKFSRQARDVKQLVVAPLGSHSTKPPEVRDRIVSLCGDVPRIELFARERVVGWDAWGNEVESDIQL